MENLKTPTLLETSHDIVIMTDIFSLQEGVITELQEVELSEKLLASKEKVTGYCAVLKKKKSESDLAKLAAKDAMDYANSIDKEIERIENAAKYCMQIRAIKKLDGLYGSSISLRESTQCEVTANPLDLPIVYQRTKVEPDKAAIKKALMEGDQIDGCRLIINQNVGWK